MSCVSFVFRFGFQPRLQSYFLLFFLLSSSFFASSYVALVGYGLVNLFLAIMTQSYDRLRQMYFDDYVQSEVSEVRERERVKRERERSCLSCYYLKTNLSQQIFFS